MRDLEEEYEVEAILGKQEGKGKGGKALYHVVRAAAAPPPKSAKSAAEAPHPHSAFGPAQQPPPLTRLLSTHSGGKATVRRMIRGSR